MGDCVDVRDHSSIPDRVTGQQLNEDSKPDEPFGCLPKSFGLLYINGHEALSIAHGYNYLPACRRMRNRRDGETLDK